MSRLIRFSLVLALVVAFLPVLPASAETLPPLPEYCQLYPTSTPSMTEEQYLICMPQNLAEWKGGVVVFAHGYVDPGQNNQKYLEQLYFKDENTWLMAAPISMGYGFIATSYSKQGLAIKEGVTDVVKLVTFFKEQIKPLPVYMVLLTGASEGGLITTLALEQYPDIFAGGLATCGPIGDFQGQVNYFGDFRVITDYFFPGLMPGSPVDMPPSLWDQWPGLTINITKELSNSLGKTAQLIKVTKASVDPADPSTAILTAQQVLWYNMFATNDAKSELSGQPFNNRFRWYFGSSNDWVLNRQVDRFSPDLTAVKNIAKYYQTSGKLSRPLVTMHNIFDPVVPYWHEPLYRMKTFFNHSMINYTNIPIPTYGHCNFTADEITKAFGYLVYRVVGVAPAGIDIQSLPIEENKDPSQIFLPVVQGQ